MKKLRTKKHSTAGIYRLAKAIKLMVFDFDGVMTDNRVLVDEDGKESVFCCRSDGLGIGFVKKAGIEVLVISKEKNRVVAARCKKLEIDCIYGCDDKIAELKRIARELKLDMSEISYMGNDVNDIECMQAVGLSVCVIDAHPEVFKYAKFVTSLEGGKGAVRELCDIIISARYAKKII